MFKLNLPDNQCERKQTHIKKKRFWKQHFQFSSLHGMVGHHYVLPRGKTEIHVHPGKQKTKLPFIFLIQCSVNKDSHKDLSVSCKISTVQNK